MSRAAVPYVVILAALLGAAPAQADEAAARAAADYLKRIAAIDDKGSAIHAVLAVNPTAVAQARAAAGPLAGRSVLVKDNIETRELPTTAGSLR